jgi:hypothetical protein
MFGLQLGHAEGPESDFGLSRCQAENQRDDGRDANQDKIVPAREKMWPNVKILLRPSMFSARLHLGASNCRGWFRRSRRSGCQSRFEQSAA